MARLSDAERAEYERGRTADYVIQPVRLEGKIRLDDYDPAWPGLFEREAARIRGVLGDRVLRLEHVGSTSVPGLAAKPIIDILLVVADPADEDAYVAPLEQAGYRLKVREPDWHDHRLLKGPDTDINLHVHRPGNPEVDRMAGWSTAGPSRRVTEKVFRSRRRADFHDHGTWSVNIADQVP